MQTQLSITHSQESLTQIRAEFLNKGLVQSDVVDEVIQRSWQRCLRNGINKEAPTTPEVVSQHDLKHRMEKSRLLLSHAEPEMLTLSEQIAHTRSLVILTDSDGVILRTTGDVIGDKETRTSLSPGASWSEAHRGTNAIGTALVERTAISVKGAEHFMSHHHTLSCSAVPIFGANNQLIATLDVSNDLYAPQQHTLALVKMAAQMVENRLFSATSQGEISVHFHARAEFIGTLWEGLALFDKNGFLQAINRSGQFQFDMRLSDCSLASRNIRFEDIFDVSWQRFSDKHLHGDGLVFPMHLQNGARMYARISKRQDAPAQALATPKKRESAASLSMLNSGDPQLATAIKQVQQVLNRDIPILIQGETGAGKELFARAIHDASARKDQAWVAVNCAAMPEGLIEAELFGYEEGAYTGAKRKGNVGKIQQANGGTLFLDEIGDMPLALQARLLRVLQERCVTPLGSSKSIPVDFVLICATNQTLKDKVADQSFRSDLYYRINGLTVHLPALRQRQDLASLIDIILGIEQASQVKISDDVMLLFQQHPWPGNVRQLHNVLRTALALADGEKITFAHLTSDFLEELNEKARLSQMNVSQINTSQIKVMSKDDFCNTVSLKAQSDVSIKLAMQQHAGNISAVARQLGVSRTTLYRKLNQLEN